MYVCMYVCIYVCMYLCMYVHICMHACIYVRTYIHVCACTYVTRFAKTRNNPANQYFQYKPLQNLVKKHVL